MRLLLVEDNPRLSALVEVELVKHGYSTQVVVNSKEALSTLSRTRFSLVILDLDLRDGAGFSILEHLRSGGGAVPILALTARRNVRARLKAFDGGADDLLRKPFNFEELAARIRALSRRPRTYLGPQVVFGGLTFDAARREVMVRGERKILGRREARLLELLLRRTNQVVPKDFLEDQIYGLAVTGSPNAVEVYIHRLRKQLEGVKSGVEIRTVKGLGYVIADHNGDDGRHSANGA